MIWEAFGKLFRNIIVRADKRVADRLCIFAKAFAAYIYSVQQSFGEGKLLQKELSSAGHQP